MVSITLAWLSDAYARGVACVAMAISEAVRQQVRSEAGYSCEYCKTSLRLIGMPLVINHVTPQSVGETDDRNNLNKLTMNITYSKY
ncbi:MAG: HNH endonuclease [Cyanobacteria bacterium P01_D01_bin.14]